MDSPIPSLEQRSPFQNQIKTLRVGDSSGQNTVVQQGMSQEIAISSPPLEAPSTYEEWPEREGLTGPPRGQGEKREGKKWEGKEEHEIPNPTYSSNIIN